MQKKLLVLAVAGAIVAPVAMANPTVYGTVNLSVDAVNGGQTSATTNALATDFIASGTSNQDSAGIYSTANFGTGTGIFATNVAQARGLRAVFQPLALSDDSRTRVTSGNSFLGIKGSEKINDSLSAVYQWEFSINFDQQDTSNLGANDNQTTQSKRNTFAGLASKHFGTVTLGLQDTPLKTSTGPLDAFGNTVADYRSIIGAFNGSVRAQNSIMYVTPNLAGVQIKALYGMANETGNGNASYYFPNSANPHVTSLSLAYAGGPVTAVVARERNIQTGSISAVAGGGNSSSSAPVASPTFITGSGLNSFFMIVPDVMPATASTTLGSMAWDTLTETTRAGLGLKFGGFKAGVAWEKTEADINAVVNRPTALNGTTTGFAGTGATFIGAAAAATNGNLFTSTAERRAYYVSAGYTFGSVTVLGAYGKAKDVDCTSNIPNAIGTSCAQSGNDTGAKQYSAGATFALSKTTSVYGVYTKTKNETNGLYSVAGGASGVAGVTPADFGEDPSAISLGMKTSF